MRFQLIEWSTSPLETKTGPIYRDLYTVTAMMHDGYCICTAHSHGGGEQETLLHSEFAGAYGLELFDTFSCHVDQGGSILLETIKKIN